MTSTSRFTKAFMALFFVLFFAACRNENHSLTVMSYNMRLCVADDGENSWQYRCGATKAMLEDRKPDIFGVQEAYEEQVNYITDNCPDYIGIGVGREDGIHEGEHMSIFYNCNTVGLIKWGTFWLSETPQTPSFGWDAACKRTATWALLEHLQSKRKFYYVNTHLDHVGLTAQRKGLELITDTIARINPEKYPMILTGDFNVTPDNPALNDLNLIMKSARQHAVKTDTLSSFNGWKKPISGAALGDNLKDNGYKGLTIDYIYYSGFESCPEFETVTKQYAGVPFISDHYPVCAVLVF